jgi:hypothetical protein
MTQYRLLRSHQRSKSQEFLDTLDKDDASSKIRQNVGKI